MTLFPTNPFAEHLLTAEQSPRLHTTDLVIHAGRISRFEDSAFGLINTFFNTIFSSPISRVTVELSRAVYGSFCALFRSFLHRALYNTATARGFLELFSRYSFTLLGNIWSESRFVNMLGRACGYSVGR